MDMEIRWRKWYVLHEIDLSNEYMRDTTGVYVIAYWNDSGKRVTVRVGQGVIWDRIKSHRENYDIMKHGRAGTHQTLCVTWAEVSSSVMRDEVERFLGETLHPIEGERFPDVYPVVVNLPSSSRPALL